MFERNTIVTTMNIAMTNRSKEEAILALPNSIQQISEPLQEYIHSKRNDMSEFLNVSVNELVFDVLIDADHVLSDGSEQKWHKISNYLKRVLKRIWRHNNQDYRWDCRQTFCRGFHIFVITI